MNSRRRLRVGTSPPTIHPSHLYERLTTTLPFLVGEGARAGKASTRTKGDNAADTHADIRSTGTRALRGLTTSGPHASLLPHTTYRIVDSYSIVRGHASEQLPVWRMLPHAGLCAGGWGVVWVNGRVGGYVWGMGDGWIISSHFLWLVALSTNAVGNETGLGAGNLHQAFTCL